MIETKEQAKIEKLAKVEKQAKEEKQTTKKERQAKRDEQELVAQGQYVVSDTRCPALYVRDCR